jgi:septation ring formation regulator EzrA
MISTIPKASMNEQLNQIVRFIEDEVKSKQAIIEKQSIIIKQLEQTISNCHERNTMQILQLQGCQKTNEGNKQLINKLLGDLARLQQDLDWYKRTFEQRSFFGTLKEKIFKNNNI